MIKNITRLMALFLVTAMLLPICGCGGPVELDVPVFEDDRQMVIGTWSGSMSNWTDEQFAYLQETSINTLVGVSEYIKFNDLFFDQAQAAGVSVIPDSRSWNGEVPEYVDHPAFAGYCVWDEPSSADFEALAEKKALWDSCMPEKMFFVNLFPGWAGGALGGSFKYYVETYLQTVQPEVLCFDHYPLMEDPEGKTVVRDSFFSDMDICSHYAKAFDVPFWYTLNCSKHMTYVQPGAAELRWQMAVGQAYGASGLVHYVYASHDPSYTCPIDWSTQAPTEIYEALVKANAEVAAWDHIYMNYTWQGTATVSSGAQDFPSTQFQLCQFAIDPTDNTGITAIETSEDMLCGVFRDENGNMAYMLTNATNPAENKDATVKLTLDGQYRGVLIIDRGKQTTIELEKNVATIAVDSSEGVFVIPLKEK